MDANVMQSAIGQKIRDLRNRRGFSQDELADRAGITRRTVQRIESGRVQPLNDTIRRMALALEVDVEELTATSGPVARRRRRQVLLHLSPLSGLLIPFAQILAPLSMWLIYRAEDNTLSEPIRDILVFHVTTTLLLATALVMISFSVPAGYILAGATLLACTALTLWNAYTVSENGTYRYLSRAVRNGDG